MTKLNVNKDTQILVQYNAPPPFTTPLLAKSSR
jgi:hypothetical protein